MFGFIAKGIGSIAKAAYNGVKKAFKKTKANVAVSANVSSAASTAEKPVSAIAPWWGKFVPWAIGGGVLYFALTSRKGGR